VDKDKHFYKINSGGKVARALSKKIKKRLENGERVLWLVSGGSTVSIARQAAELLSGVNLEKLTVGLADERYGQPGHKDSNWQKLLESGFGLEGASLMPVLNGQPPEVTAKQYGKQLDRALEAAGYSLALLGMGSDGHTAGIMPDSPAIAARSSVITYKYRDFQRVTLTVRALSRLSEVILHAVGKDKQAALKDLGSKSLSVQVQPAQLIKRIPRWTVYNDVVGEEI
jgi:6-phosphogluconolactonase/glucosamine-6-phosphate isomerase/deaminase